MRTYSGRMVQGIAHTKVRLTIGKDYVTGYVFDGDSWWFIEPLRKFQPTAKLGEHLVYNAKDVRLTKDLSHDVRRREATEAAPATKAVQQLSNFNTHPPDGGYDPNDDPCKPRCTPPTPPPPYLQIGMNFMADKEFEAMSNSTFADEAALVNDLNGVYERTVNITFTILTSTDDSKTNPCFTATTSDALLTQVAQCFSQMNPSATVGPNDLVHLISGKGLESNVLGRSWQPGSYALSTRHLESVVGWGIPADPAVIDLATMMHEIGHNFDGCHNEGDRWCSFSVFGWCWNYHNTIMYPRNSGHTRLYFSFGDREGDHNNAERLRSTPRIA